MSLQRQTYIEQAQMYLQKIEQKLNIQTQNKAEKCLVKNLYVRTIAICKHVGTTPTFRDKQPLILKWHSCAEQLYSHILQTDPPVTSGHMLHRTITTLKDLHNELQKDTFLSNNKKKTTIKTLRET